MSLFSSSKESTKLPPIFQGYLKILVILGKYASRWVELYDDHLVWYADKKGLKFGSCKINDKTELKDSQHKAFTFILVNENNVSVQFHASTEADKQEWKSKLHSVLESAKRVRASHRSGLIGVGGGGSVDKMTVSNTVLTRPIIHVKIIEACNLRAADQNGFSDPYVKCVVGNSLSQTSVRKKTLDPVWGVIFDFDRSRSMRYAKFDVYDKDALNADDHLGSVMVPLLSLKTKQPSQPEWHKLERKSSKDPYAHGELKLEINLEYDYEDNRHLNLLKFYDEVRMLPEFNLNILGENNPVFPCTFPPRQLEMLEDASVCVSMYCRSVSSKVYSKGIVFLTNFRLIFFSLPRLYEICNMAPNRKMLFDLIKDENSDLSTQIPLGSIVECFHQHKADRAGVMAEHFKIKTSDNRLLKFAYLNDLVYNLPSSDSFRNSRSQSITEQEISNLEISFMSLLSESCADIDALNSDEGTPFTRISRRLETVVNNRHVLNYNMSKIHGKILNPIRTCIDLKRSTSLKSKSVEEPTSVDPHGAIGPDTLSPQLSMGWSAENELLQDECEFSLTSFRKNINDLSLESLETLDENFRVGWTNYNPADEYRRMQCPDWLWRLTTINEKYAVCPTYPQVLAVPNSEELTDGIIIESSQFRSKGRFPVLSWRNSNGENTCSIMRCAQPLVGIGSARSASDELLIEWANYCGGDMAIKRFVSKDANFNPKAEKCKPFFIFDARPLLNASANQVAGKGTENSRNYKNAEILFMDISNIHAVRSSLESLEKGVIEDENSWMKALDTSLWLYNIRKILMAAVKITQCIRIENISVMVHCSDGWDRTAQLTSLSMLLSDPYYRTLKGFAVLIEKEWVSFGHKFQERLGWSEKGWTDEEKSPVFLQFLDCVHQCLVQEGSAFEFTESMLIFIAEHLHSGWFGNFLFECHMDLEENKPTTISIWTYILNNSELFTNKHFSPTSAPIIPIISQHRMVFWSGWFLRWQDKIWKSEYRHDILAVATNGQDLSADYALDSSNHNDDGSGTRWTDEKSVSGCLKCGKAFSLFRRKHHCRKCGNVFCENCSSCHRLVHGKMSRCCIDCAIKIDQEDGVQREISRKTSTAGTSGSSDRPLSTGGAKCNDDS